jgi:hypothetical protein
MALNGYGLIGDMALLVALFLLYRRSPKLSGIVVAVMTIALVLWNIAASLWEV